MLPPLLYKLYRILKNKVCLKLLKYLSGRNKMKKYLGKDFVLKSVFINNSCITFVNLVLKIAKSLLQNRIDEFGQIVHKLDPPLGS